MPDPLNILTALFVGLLFAALTLWAQCAAGLP